MILNISVNIIEKHNSSIIVNHIAISAKVVLLILLPQA